MMCQRYGCECGTEYCQTDHIRNREPNDHDEMVYTIRKLIKEIENRNNTTDIIYMIAPDDRRIRYCYDCDSIKSITYFSEP